MQRFFEPRSVVLIGTSRQTGPGAYNNLEMMVSYGYQGRIYLVHPKVTEIMGYRTYPQVADLPEAPDLAVISLGRERVVPAVRECVQRGIKGLVIISQGFADADARGRELEEQMVALARAHGARLVGPNTMGIINPFASFSTAFVDVPREPRPEPLTLVAQSGAFQVSPSSLIVKMGKAIDVGNAGDVDMTDVLEYLENDHQTRIIVMHLEGLKRGREFLQTACRVARRKPIIALKTGRSSAGARAALSHTGSLVGEDAVVDLALARAGIVRVRTTVELRAACRAFLSYQALRGPRLGVVTATGAFGIIAADACEDYGLTLAPFPETLRELEEERIAWHKLNNPVDVWPLGMVTGSFMGVFRRAAAGLLQADDVDAVLGVAPIMSSPRHADLDVVGAVRRLSAKNLGGKPLALLLYGEEAARQAHIPALEAIPGVACFDSMDEAVMGLAALHRYQKFRQQNLKPARFALPPAGDENRRPLPKGAVLVGQAALGLVEPYGLAAVSGALVQEAAEAAARAGEMGYPVVLKIVSPEWLHKSDQGGVRLNLSTETELQGAFRELTDRFRKQTPGGTLTGILVQKQVQGVELLLGLKRDPQLGPVLLAGAGGIYTEILKDVTRGLVPVSREEARAMLAGLKIFPILQGARGQAGVNLALLEDALAGLSRLAADYPEIQELDLNPVMATAAGCWAVDCRVVT